jgi:hypothetical protein
MRVLVLQGRKSSLTLRAASGALWGWSTEVYSPKCLEGVF